MASGLESTPVFRARARQVDMRETDIDLLAASGIDTMGSYAFCCSSQPGSSDEGPLVAVLTQVLNGPPTVAVMARMRRLFYEAHTLAIVDMKSRLDRSDEDLPRKLLGPERLERMMLLRRRLPGFTIEGQLEFSHALLDKCIDQFERNELKFIPLEECTWRLQELEGVKRDDKLKIEIKKDASLKFASEPVAPVATLTSDLEFRNAFVRRALAYDAANLITFALHESWIMKLFRIMQEPALEGYRAISIEQVIKADKRLWTRMADATRSAIVPAAGQAKPLDTSLAIFMVDVEVTFLLLPLALPTGKTAHSEAAPYKKEEKVKGKGKGKPKAKGAKNNAPAKEVKVGASGCAFMTPDGKPICVWFNTAGCNSKNVACGKRCARGWHLCSKPGCGGVHAMGQCTTAPGA